MTARRARDLGIAFDGDTGRHNAITDVAGVRVGMVTLVHGDGALRVGEGPVRTGVTAIHPRHPDRTGDACAAGWYCLNGNGEMTGTAWITETGTLTTPVVLTNTHAVGAAHRGVVNWMLRRRPELGKGWLLPVVGETWDGYLNDTNGDHVTPEHAMQALDAAVEGPVSEGSVGGGTGMNCYTFKGGTGTSSRLVDVEGERYTVGVLVQANFGARQELVIRGVPVGRWLSADDPIREWEAGMPSGAGSVIVVVATDAPLLPHQCTALARRVPLGLARTGTAGSHFSGDLFLAFSTANPGMLNSRPPASRTGTEGLDTLRFIPWGNLDGLYSGLVQAVEESVVNALVAASTMIGRDGHHTPGIDHDELRMLLGSGGGA